MRRGRGEVEEVVCTAGANLAEAGAEVAYSP
jgi:hypothetical protein